MSEYSKNFKEFKKYIKDYLIPSQKDGRGLQGQILAKARRIKTLVKESIPALKTQLTQMTTQLPQLAN